jgi:hypothetical protein
MKDIVIKKTSDESQRIVLQTDSETLDYQSRFTVMTVTGNIDGLVNPFRVGSVTSLYEISQFLADNSSASIDVNILSQDVEVEEMEAAVPRILEANLYAIVDESSYKNFTNPGYADKYPYDTQKQYLPWLKFDIKKSVKATPYTVDVSHDGTPCNMGGNTSDFGEVDGTKLTISDPEKTYLMLDPKTDLGATNPNGVWTMKFTMNNVSITREVVIS